MVEKNHFRYSDIKNDQIHVKWFLGCSLSCVRSLISDISSLEVHKIILKLIYKYVSPGLEAVQHWSQRQTAKPPDFEHLFPIYKLWRWIIIAFLGQIMPKFLHEYELWDGVFNVRSRVFIDLWLLRFPSVGQINHFLFLHKNKSAANIAWQITFY